MTRGERERMSALRLALLEYRGELAGRAFECEDEAQARRIYDEAKRLAVLMAMRRWEPVCRDLTG